MHSQTRAETLIRVPGIRTYPLGSGMVPTTRPLTLAIFPSSAEWEGNTQRRTWPMLRTPWPIRPRAARRAKGTAMLCLLLAAAIHARADYTFKIVAQTGQGGILSIGQNVSINAGGFVAFTATTANGISGFVGNGDSPPKSVTPPPTAGGVYAGVQINNAGQVVVERGPFSLYIDPVIYYDPISGPITISPGYADSYGFLQLYDANGSAGSQTVAAFDFRVLDSGVSGIGTLAQGPFSYIGPAFSLNNNGGAVFIADTSTGLNPAYVMATPGPGQTYNTTPMWIGAQPMIADDGQIVVRNGQSQTDPIVLYPSNLSSPTPVASVAAGFTSLGQAPGISDDGQYIAFYGELSETGAANLGTSAGPGIFLSALTSSAWRTERLVGLANPDGTVLSSFDASQRVGVAALAGTGAQAVVVFAAVDGAGIKGLFAARCTPGTGEPVQLDKIIKQGDSLAESQVQALALFDPVNPAGEAAFLAQTANGSVVAKWTPPAQAELSGHIYSACDDKPILGANVQLDSLSTTSDKNGAYSFTAVGAGMHHLTATATSYATFTDTVTVLASETSLFEDCPLSPLTVTVTGHLSNKCDGTPIAGVSVQIGASIATSDTDGAYSLGGLQAGTLTVTVNQGGYLPLSMPLTLSACPATVTQDFTLSPLISLTGRVKNACDGSPIAGASVQIGASIATSDTDGAYSLGGLQAGALMVTVSQSGYPPLVSTLTVPPCPAAAAKDFVVGPLPVAFTQQPQGRLVQCAKGYTLRAVCSGTSPISYQWFHNDFPVPGATDSSYKIKNFAGFDTGMWSVQASDACDTEVSSKVWLDLAPNILVPPASQTVLEGHRAVFGFTVCGEPPLPYKWYHNGVPVRGGSDCLTSPAGAALTLNSVQPQDAGTYQVAVWEKWTLVLSKAATLTVVVPPRITKQPASLTVMQGMQATFHVVAAGTAPLAYQWFFNGASISKALQPALAIPNVVFASAGAYRVVVTNLAGSVTSATALLQVVAPSPPVISSLSPSSGPTNGGTRVSISGEWFELGAAVSFGSAPAASVRVSSPTTIVAVTPPGTLGPADVRVTDPGGQSAIATNGFAYVGPSAAPPSISAPPASQVASLGADVTLSVVAAGGTPLSYRWVVNDTNLVDGGSVSGATTAALSLTPVALADAGAYSVVISNSTGLVTSAAAILSVVVPPSIYGFTGGEDGSGPAGGIIRGDDGSFYGTTRAGGAYTDFDPAGVGYGTVFRIPANGILDTLFSFTGGEDGANPSAGLAQGPDGELYGTTSGGGAYDFGTVFQISTNGVFTSLYSFTGGKDGARPCGTLAEAGDGSFYGTTTYGGPDTNAVDVLGDTGYGTVFRIAPNGLFTGLYSFTGGSDGGNPRAGVIRGADGNLYGTTAYGGPYTNAADNSGTLGWGIVFQLTTNGTLNTLYAFTGGDDGANPLGGLTEALDGSFYGTTYAGGTNGYGSVFQVTTNGTLTGLYAFTGFGDGIGPAGALVQGMDGNLYGSTRFGGSSSNLVDPDGDFGYGTVFELGTNGVFATVISFDGTNGAAPTGALTLGTDGQLYGTTAEGGAVGAGTVFRVGPAAGPPAAASPPAISSQPADQTVMPGSVVLLAASVSGAQPLFYQWTFGGTNLPGATNPLLTITNAQPLDAGIYSLAVLNPFGSATSAPVTLTVIAPPSIVVPPANQTVALGSNVTFDALAVGSGPLSYQWLFDQTNLDGATASSYGLNGVGLTNAGVYTVVVSNPYGTASASATLTVGVVLSASSSAGRLLLGWPTPYALQTATNLSGPYIDVPGAASPYTNSIGSGPNRFFRLRLR